MAEQIETLKVKKSVARKVTQHTMLAALITIDCYGGPYDYTADLQADLLELQKLERSPLVDAAVELVTIGIAHAKKPTTETFDKARIARDALGDLLMTAKEIKG